MQQLSPRARRVRRSIMHRITRTLNKEGDVNKKAAFVKQFYDLVQQSVTDVLGDEEI